MDRILTGAERDVGRDATEPLEIGRLECREHGDHDDLVQRHHARPRFDPFATGQRYCARSRSARGVPESPSIQAKPHDS